MRKGIMLGLIAMSCSLLVGSVQAQNSTFLTFTSFMYESDNTPGVQGFPPSNEGDVMTAVGFIESVGPELDWDTEAVQLTVVMYDLISTGEQDIGNGLYYIVYTGGSVDIIANAYSDPNYTYPDYGVEPSNATSPSTFWDGEVYLTGQFYSFYMTYYPALHIGSFEGYLDWTGGSQLNLMYPDPEGYTLAGTVDPFGAQVPDGYDLEAVGDITFDPAIPVKENTWGQVKSLYR